MSEIRKKENPWERSKRDENLGKATQNIFQLMVIMSFCYCLCWGFNMTYVALWIAGVFKNLSGKRWYHYVSLYASDHFF